MFKKNLVTKQPRYLTFEQIITRTIYGTDIYVFEEYPRKEIFRGKLEWNYDINKFGSDVLSAEATCFTAKDGVLHIGIIKQN